MIEVAKVWPVAEAVRGIRRRDVVGWLRWLPEVVRLAFPVVLVIVVAKATGDRDLAFLLIGLSLALWVVRWGADRLVWKANESAWRKSPTWPLPNTWWLDDKGITISDGAFTRFIRWGACIAFHVERDRLVFMLSPAHGEVLPIRFLDAGAGQLQQIRALVDQVRAEGRLGRGVD